MLPFQHPAILGELIASFPRTTARRAASDFESCFWLQDDLAVCAIEGDAVCGNLPDNKLTPTVLDKWARSLGNRHLYFPLVYESSPVFADLSGLAGVMRLLRRPTCLVSLPLSEGTLHSRARARIGSRVDRRLKRFARSNARLETLSGEQAVSAMAAVEAASWKYSVQQSLYHSGQFSFFRNLIRQSLVELRLVTLDEAPVAYRLDFVFERTAYVWKWSFSERYRSISPGFYLLVCDLYNSYAAKEIDTVDLYGSPDLLKLAICDRFEDRYDFYWPESSAGREYLAERAAHDARCRELLEHGRSMKGAYTQ